MSTFLKHLPGLLLAMIVVGATSGLAAIGTITGSQALYAIGAVVSFVLGGTLVLVGTSTGATAAKPPPPS